ncbi:MAG: M50 family metallopeptidase [Micrococcales bacterium]
MSEVLWYIAGVVFIAIGIGFSIGWHELGHLLPAKRFGVKVPRYMIGFGPLLFSRKRGETEYGIKLIPLGGYITMIGMYPPAKAGTAEGAKRKGFAADSIAAARNAHSEHVTAADANRMFYQLPVLKRMAIMFGGPFMNLLLAMVLTIVSICGFGGYVRSTTITSVSECVPSSFTKEVACAATDALSPAKAAGLKAGEQVLAVNGVEVSNFDQVTQYAAAHPGSLTFDVLVGHNREQVSITPVMVTRPIVQADGSTKTGKAPFFGVILGSVRQAQPIGSAFAYAGNTLAQTFNLIATLPVQVYQSLSDTIQGKHRSSSGAVSIIGVGQAAGEIASNQQANFEDKFSSGLMMLASLNFALFAFNMIPLLPLDGGHIAGAIYESLKRAIWRLRGKGDPGPADTALLMPLTYVVTTLLIALSLVLLVLDLVNPISL